MVGARRVGRFRLAIFPFGMNRNDGRDLRENKPRECQAA